jgi:hypothetical protein
MNADSFKDYKSPTPLLNLVHIRIYKQKLNYYNMNTLNSWQPIQRQPQASFDAMLRAFAAPFALHSSAASRYIL